MNESHGSHERSQRGSHGRAMYRRLGLMSLLSFVAMYFLMYAMVDEVNNVFMNLNQVYMAAVMAAPMVVLELAFMKDMYRDGRRNLAVAAFAIIIGVIAFLAIRRQTLIGDRQFARSMIPHHASAILMCRQASVRDSLLRSLCDNPDGIVASQEREIAQLKEFLRAGRQTQP